MQAWSDCRRRADRVGSRTQLLIRSRRGYYSKAWLINVSERGACLECPISVDPQDVRVYLKVDGRFLSMQGRLAWSRIGDCGTRLIGITLEAVPCDHGSFSIWLLRQRLLQAA